MSCKNPLRNFKWSKRTSKVLINFSLILQMQHVPNCRCAFTLRRISIPYLVDPSPCSFIPTSGSATPSFDAHIDFSLKPIQTKCVHRRSITDKLTALTNP